MGGFNITPSYNGSSFINPFNPALLPLNKFIVIETSLSAEFRVTEAREQGELKTDAYNWNKNNFSNTASFHIVYPLTPTRNITLGLGRMPYSGFRYATSINEQAFPNQSPAQFYFAGRGGFHMHYIGIGGNILSNKESKAYSEQPLGLNRLDFLNIGLKLNLLSGQSTLQDSMEFINPLFNESYQYQIFTNRSYQTKAGFSLGLASQVNMFDNFNIGLALVYDSKYNIRTPSNEVSLTDATGKVNQEELIQFGLSFEDLFTETPSRARGMLEVPNRFAIGASLAKDSLTLHINYVQQNWSSSAAEGSLPASALSSLKIFNVGTEFQLNQKHKARTGFSYTSMYQKPEQTEPNRLLWHIGYSYTKECENGRVMSFSLTHTRGNETYNTSIFGNSKLRQWQLSILWRSFYEGGRGTTYK